MDDKTLVITGRDIERSLDMKATVAIVEKAFRAHAAGRVQMPPKIYIHLPRYHGDFRAMPAYVEGLDGCGVKWVNVHPENRSRGLPVVMATIILSDPRTGKLLAILDGTLITNMRTGAAGAVAAKYLARAGSSSVAFVGCGVQARYQLMALTTVLAIRTVSLYDRSAAQVRSMARWARRSGVAVRSCAGIEECVRGSDIVVTTTPSRTPIVKASWIAPGTHINAIGADAKGKQELETALVRRSQIIVDDIPQAVHSGEINVPISTGRLRAADIRSTLGKVAAGATAGRRSDSEITLFDSTGLAIQDIAVASHLYRRLRSRRSRIQPIKVSLR